MINLSAVNITPRVNPSFGFNPINNPRNVFQNVIDAASEDDFFRIGIKQLSHKKRAVQDYANAALEIAQNSQAPKRVLGHAINTLNSLEAKRFKGLDGLKSRLEKQFNKED